MKYQISEDYSEIAISVDEKERLVLQEILDQNPLDFVTDENMSSFLEPLFANSELEWIDPSWSGDLTSAPMIGILGKEESHELSDWLGLGLLFEGQWDDKKWFRPILFRWAYMNYEIRSPLHDLLEKGSVKFVGGKLLNREDSNLIVMHN